MAGLLINGKEPKSSFFVKLAAHAWPLGHLALIANFAAGVSM